MNRKPLNMNRPGRRSDRGAVIAMVAIMMVVVASLAALAVDLSHLMVVRNELQNAADAGALSGARVLYLNNGTAVNEGANLEAYSAARANSAISKQGTIAVDVNWTNGTNSGDVQRGHWSFGLGNLARGFYPNDSTVPVSLWNQSTVDLDENTDFINAVRVVARRDATRAESFFARIFGYEDFAMSADAVGYIGFAGTLNPTEADQPIAICKQMIVDDAGNYTCNTGRMLNSSGGTTSNTAAWTNFSQPCETASANSMRPLICGSGNPNPITYGEGIGTVNGVQDNIFRDLQDCWLSAALAKSTATDRPQRQYPREPWSLTLPVIDCPSPAISNCADAVGAVTVDVVWIKDANADPDWTNVPVEMGDWTCAGWVGAGSPADLNALTVPQRQQCWSDFAQHFNLRTWDETSIGNLAASDIQKTIVFLPSCEPHEPAGVTGGENFGVLSEIPVLVE